MKKIILKIYEYINYNFPKYSKFYLYTLNMRYYKNAFQNRIMRKYILYYVKYTQVNNILIQS